MTSRITSTTQTRGIISKHSTEQPILWLNTNKKIDENGLRDVAKTLKIDTEDTGGVCFGLSNGDQLSLSNIIIAQTRLIEALITTLTEKKIISKSEIKDFLDAKELICKLTEGENK